MIPKIIHYCWFGNGEKTSLVNKCISSWEQYCPDYEIIEWNENNFDVTCCEFVSSAYKERKWAFVADYVRLYALVNYGGIYMDTDVEVCKNLDAFLDNVAFSGFQTIDTIPTGIMACEKDYHVFKKLLNDYNDRNFYNENGEPELITNVVHITNEYKKYGVVLTNTKQTVAGLTLFPVDYFCAKSDETGIISITENTHTIHHFAGSWLNKQEIQKRKGVYFIFKHFGVLAPIVAFFYKGFFYYLFRPGNIIKKLRGEKH